MASNFNTLQLHAGREPDIASNSRAVPIYSSTSFVFNNSAHASAIMSLQEVGNVCSRIGNPTVAVFETRMAALEGGTAAVAASSGQSAQFVTLSAICSTGDNIVSTSCLYGGTYNQFKVFLKRFGIETKFVEGDNPEDFEKFIDNKTKAIYLESIGSSKWNVPDLPKFAPLRPPLPSSLIRSTTFFVLRSHPSHFTATRIIRPNTGYGGVLSFGVQGGLQEASIGSLVVDNLKLASHLANVGDAKTLVIHPSSTTHAQLSSEEQRAAGITADMIRVSVGIEFIDDSIADFAQCFEETGKAIGGSNSKSQGDASNKNGSKVSPKAEHGAGFEI